MADSNGKGAESGDQSSLVTNQLPPPMNNNPSSLGSGDAKVSNGPGTTTVVSEDKGITCAERSSNEARSSHALNKVIALINAN